MLETATPTTDAAIPDSKSKSKFYSIANKYSDINLIYKIFDYFISIVYIIFMLLSLVFTALINLKIIVL